MKKIHQNNFQAAADFINGHDDFLVTTHYSPDGDAVGSCLGMSELLTRLGKRHISSIEGGLPEKYDFLHCDDRIIDPLVSKRSEKYGNIIILDAGDLVRIGKSSELLDASPRILNVDHHISNDGFGEVNYIDTEASSVAEIIYEIARFMSVEISQVMASYLYIGIMTDTGRFRFGNTSPKAMRICADLIELGAEPAELAEQIYHNLPVSYIEALGKSLNSLKFYGGGSFALIEYLDSREIEDAEGMVDFVLGMKGVRAAAFIRLMNDDRFKVSLRARDNLNVGEIAESFGGGGHRKAAGFRYRGKLSELKCTLEEIIISKLQADDGNSS